MARIRSFFVGLLLLGASLVGAQLPMGDGMPNVQYMPHLILNPKVQKELKVSPKIAAKVQGILIEEGMKMLATMNNKQQATPTEQKKMMDGAVAAYNRMESRTLVLLTSPQKARLRQLSLQTLGPMAILQPKVGSELALTKTQKERLADVIATDNRYVFTGMSSGGNPNDANAARKRALDAARRQAGAREASEAALAKILTPKQRAKWKAMLGKRMDLGTMGLGNMLGG